MSPRVPIAQRRVQTAPLNIPQANPNAPDSAFGVTAPNPISGAVQEFESIVAEETAAMDKVVVTEKLNELHTFDTDTMTEVQERFRGKEAVMAGSFVESKRRARVSEIEMSLNERQRRAFRNAADERWQSLYTRLETYGSQEVERYKTETYTASLTNLQNDAVDDPTQAVAHVGTGRAIIANFAKEQRWSPERTTQALEEFTSRTHARVIAQHLANRNDLVARDYFEANKDALTGDDLTRAQEAVRASSIMGEGQRHADEIIAKRGITRPEAFERARKIKDPEIRQETEQRLDVEFRRREQAEREADEARFDAAANFAEQGQRPPAHVWARLSLQERSAIDTRIRQVAAREATGTDWATYYGLKLAASVEATGQPSGPKSANPRNRAEFSQTNLLRYRHLLGDDEFKELVRLQVDARNGGGTASLLELDGFRSVHDIVSGTAASIKLSPAQKEVYLRAVDRAVRAVQLRENRKATNEEVMEIASSMVGKGIQGAGVLGFLKQRRRLFEIEPGTTVTVSYDDVPEDSRSSIRQAIQEERGLSDPTLITDDEVAEAYTAHVNSTYLSDPWSTSRGDSTGVVRLEPTARVEERRSATGSMIRGALAGGAAGTLTMGPLGGLAGLLGGAAAGPIMNVLGREGPEVVADAWQETPEERARARNEPPPTPPGTPPTTSQRPTANRGTPDVYTADTVIEAIVAHRDRDVRNLRIPGETEDLDAREAFLEALLKNKHSLNRRRPDNTALIKNAKAALSRIHAIRRGEIEPSDLRNYIGG